MNIVLLGSGGREHALAWRLRHCRDVADIVCPNGNPGIAEEARTPRVELRSADDYAEFAVRERADLVVVGPEVPLAAGAGDAIRRRGIPVFGPNRDGAMIESSKSWAKQLMLASGVPTAAGERFEETKAAMDFAASLGYPVVVKADGLAAGKGVLIARSAAEAREFIELVLHSETFATSARSVVVEEFLEGDELSVFALCDGETLFTIATARDHKRAYDGDAGPNTGGMGAYSPGTADAGLVAQIERDILRPTLLGLQECAIDYRGVLYAGLMLTAKGPRVLEYNCRFGDPETQVIMPLLEGDLAGTLLACATGRLADAMRPHGGRPLAHCKAGEHAVTVVVASGGYPGDVVHGFPIDGVDGVDHGRRAKVFQAGTARDEEGRVVSAGGRVLNCTGWDTSLAAARQRAYDLVSSVSFNGCRSRSDIAAAPPQQGIGKP
jgi:phosphoribosylamine--glycine ligase